ncbi:MAG: fibronectin type III domain-containing protein [Deltaproteobacteria bacterium]|nr:fibronectin type III domain-containing protein [Deltaproteobacteria bacterium]
MKSRFLYFLACVFIYFVPLIFILLLSTQNVYSLDVTLSWNPNSEKDLAGYRIFYREDDQSYDYEEPAWQGSETTCTIYNLDDKTTYYFVARAFDSWGSESGNSKETIYAALSDTVEIGDSNEASYAALLGSSESGNSNEACYAALLGTVEIGEVGVDHNWKWVEFNDTFIDPVVVANPLSYNGGDPAVLRIRNVDSRGFDIRVQKWDYLNGTHTTENASYIVMERGSYILEDGTKVEAGKFDINATGAFSFGWVDFSETFNQVPVVTSTVSSFNEEDAVCSRLKNIDTTGFDFCMQEQQLNRQIHTTETISYIAWEPSSGTVGNLTFEVDKTDDIIRHNWQTIVYNKTFMATPVFLADMQTTDGKDTANLRWQNKDFYGIDIKITEEQSRDSEMKHTTEVVGYMVFALE